VLAKHKMALRKLAEQDTDAAVRVSAYGALHKIEPTAGHIETILPRLEDSELQVRVAAVRALGNLEPVELAKYAAVLVARLEESDQDVRRWAVETLAKLELAELAKYAEVLQKRANEDVREAATKAFAQLQASCKPASDLARVRRETLLLVSWHNLARICADRSEAADESAVECAVNHQSVEVP
jgi:HEAT repeat protein